MIRPFTLICMASAFGAGLYLYQSKHAAQVLDREITRTLKQTEATRERTGMLRAEWALLNEPDRLAELAKAHLQLQTLKPTQFAAMSDLGTRLPGPVASRREVLPSESEPEERPMPIAQAAPAPPPAPAVTSKPKEASPPESKPKVEPKSEPRQVVEAKPAPRPVEKAIEKPVVARAEPVRPVEVAMPVHPRAFVPPPTSANSEATAPGTVGAAVLRAMRARANEEAAAAPAAPPPARVYATPAYVQPSYQPPAPVQPSYAQPGAASVLGGRTALPPPVPFAAR